MYIELQNLKRQIWCLCVVACLFGFSSCVSDEDKHISSSEDEYLHLTFTKTVSRADLSSDGAGNFSEGDCVGLYVKSEGGLHYEELTLQDGEWYPRLKRSDFGAGTLTLSAHYPVLPESSRSNPETASFQVALQQDEDGKKASDLLFAQSVLDEGTNRAALSFTHALHRLKVQLQNAPGDTKVYVSSKVNGNVNLLTGTASLASGEVQWITPFQNSDGVWEAILYPQSATPYREGEGLLKIVTGGKDYFFKAPEKLTDGTTLENFEAGKQVSVRVSLKEGDIQWANRKVWVYGITPPEPTDWKRSYYPALTSYDLPWKKEYGWYDCNKRNPSAKPGGIPDGMMCWAATASNMLHWWIAQNKKYIDLYGDKYKGPDYTYPLNKPQESDIFQCFIDAFKDEAGKGDDGVNWFIHGVIPSLPALENANHGGYFKDVFPDGVRLGTNVGGLGKANFNKVMKEALSGKKAIGATVGPVRTGHVVTIWGAEFDENGEVSYIYLADNNDRDSYEFFEIGCFRYEVVYEQYPEGSTYTCYKTGVEGGEKPTTITRLVFLDLGEEYWKQYLGIQ